MKLEDQTNSYMRLQLHADEGLTYELRVPTFWDSVKKEWMGVLKLPVSKKLIAVHGSTSLELQNNFNIELHKYLTDEKYHEEIFSLFKEIK